MYLPNETAVLNEVPVTVTSVQGHQVTVRTPDGDLKTVPETDLPRSIPPAPKPSLDRPERLNYKLEGLLLETLSQMTLDWNGHHQNGVFWTSGDWYRPEPERRKDLFRNLAYDWNLTNEECQEILEAFNSKVPMTRWISIGAPHGREGLSCGNCDRHSFETNGLIIRPSEPCPRPDGLITEFTLNVPSGKMVMANDLRHLCRIPGDRRNIGTAYGTHLAIMDYANAGLVCGFGIGNTCPGVARHTGGRYTIGHRQGGRRVTGICTDLWAYSMMDLDEAMRRAEYYGYDLEKTRADLESEVVRVKPGLYRFRHYHNMDRNANKILFAEFERVGPATELQDWISRDRGFTAELSQVVQHQIQEWPTLFGDREGLESWKAVLVFQFQGCIPDRDWHPNGHKNDFMAEDLEKFPVTEIPHFRCHHPWKVQHTVIETAVTRKDALFGGDISFNRSYAIGAGRILESVISFGIRPQHISHDKSHPRYDQFTVPEARAEMHQAADLWYGLIERYPHVAEESPVFAAWMEDREAVKAWIDAFNLGPVKFDRAAWEAQQEIQTRQWRSFWDRRWMHRSGIQVRSQKTQELGYSRGLPEDSEDLNVDVQWGLVRDDDAEAVSVPLTELELGPEGCALRDEITKKTVDDLKGLV